MFAPVQTLQSEHHWFANTLTFFPFILLVRWLDLLDALLLKVAHDLSFHLSHLLISLRVILSGGLISFTLMIHVEGRPTEETHIGGRHVGLGVLEILICSIEMRDVGDIGFAFGVWPFLAHCHVVLLRHSHWASLVSRFLLIIDRSGLNLSHSDRLWIEVVKIFTFLAVNSLFPFLPLLSLLLPV